VIPLAPQVAGAVAAVREHFAGFTVEVVPDGSGGAFVTVDHIPISASYVPSVTWLGFQINAAYPASDVYPHYCGPVTRTDGQAHGTGISAATWRDRPALQLSRRSNGWNPAVDNAALKAVKVITWLAEL
jgi:hypothetical protein